EQFDKPLDQCHWLDSRVRAFNLRTLKDRSVAAAIPAHPSTCPMSHGDGLPPRSGPVTGKLGRSVGLAPYAESDKAQMFGRLCLQASDVPPVHEGHDPSVCHAAHFIEALPQLRITKGIEGKKARGPVAACPRAFVRHVRV